MPKRSNAPKRKGTEHDFTLVARRVVEQAIGERLDGSPLIDPNASKDVKAVERGRRGGRKGGRARADALSARKRRQIAKKAAAARWNRSS